MTESQQTFAKFITLPLTRQISMVRDCGLGALVAKADIESTIRLLPVHPEDFCLLGF